MELVVQEHRDHVFTRNALTALTAELTAEKTMGRSVLRDLEPTCKVATHLNKGNIAHVIIIITTTTVAISNAVITTIKTVEVNNNAKKVDTVHVITTLVKAKEATNNVLTTNLDRKADTVLVKKGDIKPIKKAVTNSDLTISLAKKAVTNNAKKEDIAHVITTKKAVINSVADTNNARTIIIVADTNNAVAITTTAVDTNKVATNNAVAINSVAVTNKATIANVHPTTIQMLNIA